MRPKGQGEAGFTLLEVLISLVVLALLILGLAQGTRFGLLATGQQSRIITRQADFDAVDRTLRRMIEQIAPGNAHDAPEIKGNANSVEFTSELPLGAGTSPTSQAEIRLLVDRSHQLLLRWAPYSHGIRIGPPPSPTDTLMLPDVDRMEISYWPHTGPPDWRGSWSEAALPALIRIRIVLVADSAVAWPDIVAAPQRSRP
jgi:general secretion pathway protein J